jgi:hypothetical protein
MRGGCQCRFAFTPLLIKLEFMERLAFLEKRTRQLFAQGALLRAQVSSLSFTNNSDKSGHLLFAQS